jgi:hypothetical protein
MTLPDRIRTYIVKCTEHKDVWVTKEQIVTAAMKTGVSHIDVLDALQQGHKMHDVQSKVHNDTVVYRLRRVQAPKTQAPTRYETTPEQRAQWDREVQDFIDNSTLLSDEERDCMRTPVKDRSDRCHYLTDTPAGYQVTMERKYTPIIWKRMQETLTIKAILGI